MPDINNEDVKEESSSPAEDSNKDVNLDESDSDKNFANLREKVKKTEEEKAELLKENELLKQKVDGGDRTLDDSDEEEDKPTADDFEKTLFKRDNKEATRLWNKEHKVSGEIWDKIKSKVSLSGTETQSEIYDKINDAYEGLPEVRKAREDSIKKETQMETIKQFQDSDLDVGSGGDFNAGEPSGFKHDAKSKKFAKGVANLTDKEISEIDPDGDTDWSLGKDPVRKSFQP
jgi:hypothetical protein